MGQQLDMYILSELLWQATSFASDDITLQTALDQAEMTRSPTKSAGRDGRWGIFQQNAPVIPGVDAHLL